MGSAILQKVCLDAPEMVKKAIFIGTFLELPYPCIMQMHLTKELLDKNIDKDLVLKLTMTFLYTSDFLKYENNIRKAVDNMKKIKINPNGYDGQVFALKSFNSSTWLDQVNTESMILVGEEDIDTPIYCSQRVHEKMKNSTLKIIKNAAHVLYREKPKELIDILKSFFK